MAWRKKLTFKLDPKIWVEVSKEGVTFVGEHERQIMDKKSIYALFTLFGIIEESLSKGDKIAASFFEYLLCKIVEATLDDMEMYWEKKWKEQKKEKSSSA